MKIKLIYPSSKLNPKFKLSKQSKIHRYPGLGLITVAALCPSNTEIRIVDDEFEDIDYEEETDLVGISLLTVNAKRAYEISENFRDRNIPVTLGGMHVTACPGEAFEHADSIVVGEAEDTWPELLKDFNSGKLKKIYKSSNNASLSNMPFPKRDLLNKKYYMTLNTIQATRGCPFNCEFCSIKASFGRKTRYRPVEEVIAEIKSLKGNAFVLNDDNLAQKREYYLELFQKLVPLKKKWVGEASWHIGKDDEILDLLERSGCGGMAIGFESLEAQPGVKKIMPSKHINIIYKEVIKKLHNHKIGVMGNFIFGFDNDTESTFEKTLDFTLDSHLDVAQFAILKPLPGTPLFKRLEQEKRITDKDWNNYAGLNLCFELKNMSAETFFKKYYWLINKFYSYREIATRVMYAVKKMSFNKACLSLAVNLGFRNQVLFTNSPARATKKNAVGA